MAIFHPAGGSTVREVLASVLRSEKENGFPTIGRLPSTEARKFIDYANGLPADRWAVLSSTLARRGSSWLIQSDNQFPYTEISAAFTENEKSELDSYHRASLTFGGAGRYMPLRLLKMSVGADKSARTPEEFAGLPDWIRAADSIETAKAADLRKLLKPVMGELGFAGKNGRGGNWVYAKSDERFDYKVALDFGGRTDQLRYRVGLRPKAGPRLAGLSLEGLLGFGNGHWNYIVAEEAQASMRLLGEIVRELIGIPDSFAGVEDFRRSA